MNENNPISIIVPCYNAANYIEKLISSLGKQTFKEFEVIFIDDCSNDATVTVIKDLISKYHLRARVLCNCVNSGPSLARKYGIDESRSRYIAFCDSDDWVEECFLEKMYAKIKEDESDLVFCNYNIVYSSNRILERRIFSNVDKRLSKKDMLTVNVDSLCLGLFSRKLFQHIKFLDIRNGEDMTLIPILISKASRCSLIDDCLYNYFQRTGSLSTNKSNTVIDNLLLSFENIYNNIDKQYKSEVEYIGIRNLLYGMFLYVMKNESDNKKAICLLENFEKRFPRWIDNEYFYKLPIYKRLFLKRVYARDFISLKMLAWVHELLTR